MALHNDQIRDIQRFAKFAQDGGYDALQGVRISTIDGQPGNNTARSMRAMSGLSNSEMGSREEFIELMEQKMQDDPAFRDAVIKGLKEAGPDNEDVQAFLKDRGVDSIEALEAKYAEPEVTVNAGYHLASFQGEDGGFELSIRHNEDGLPYPTEPDTLVAADFDGLRPDLGFDLSEKVSLFLINVEESGVSSNAFLTALNEAGLDKEQLAVMKGLAPESLITIIDEAIETAPEKSATLVAPEVIDPGLGAANAAPAPPQVTEEPEVVVTVPDQYELQALLNARGHGEIVGKIDGVVGNNTNKGIAAEGLAEIGNNPADEEVSGTIDALREKVVAEMTPERFEEIVSNAATPEGAMVLEATLIALGHDDIAFGEGLDEGITAKVNEVRAELESAAAAAADKEAALGRIFEDTAGEAFHFVVGDDGTLMLSKVIGEVGYEDLSQRNEDALLARLEAEGIDVEAKIREAIEQHLGIGEGGNNAYDETRFAALWHQTESSWGRIDQVKEHAYYIMSDIRKNYMGVPSDMVDAVQTSPVDYFDVDITISPSGVIALPSPNELANYNTSNEVFNWLGVNDPETLKVAIQEAISEKIAAEDLSTEELIRMKSFAERILPHYGDDEPVMRATQEAVIAAIDEKLGTNLAPVAALVGPDQPDA